MSSANRVGESIFYDFDSRKSLTLCFVIIPRSSSFPHFLIIFFAFDFNNLFPIAIVDAWWSIFQTNKLFQHIHRERNKVDGWRGKMYD